VSGRARGRLVALMDATEWALARVVALALLAMMLLTALDVAGRYLFSAPLRGAFEITELALGILVFGTFPLLARQGGHIRIDLLSGRLTGPSRRWHASLSGLLSGVVLAVIAWQVAGVARSEATLGYTTMTLGLPTWPFLAAIAALAALDAILSAGYGAASLLERDGTGR